MSIFSHFRHFQANMASFFQGVLSVITAKARIHIVTLLHTGLPLPMIAGKRARPPLRGLLSLPECRAGYGDDIEFDAWVFIRGKWL